MNQLSVNLPESMSKEDHIWKLVIKELTREAATGNMDELHQLIAQNPDIEDDLQMMSNWWSPLTTPIQMLDGPALFEKIMKRIKEIEAPPPKGYKHPQLKDAEQQTHK